MTIHELQQQLGAMTKIASIIEKSIERIKGKIELSEKSDSNTILVGGIRWARLNLGATIDKPCGELYDFDAAQKAIPIGWKIPTKEQWRQLKERTTSEWITHDGINGRLFTDKDNGNEIFLPTNGRRHRGDGTQNYQRSQGLYWSSSVYSADNGYFLYLFSGGVNPKGNFPRSFGLSVRCVQAA